MRILIEGGDLNPPYVEGTKNIVLTHIKELIKRGHEIIVLTRKKERITGNIFSDYEFKDKIIYYRWNDYLDLLLCLRKIRKIGVDVTHIFAKGLRPPLYLTLIKKILGKKIIFTLLGYPFEDKYDYTHFKSFLKKIDVLTISSKTIFKELNKKYRCKKIIFLRYGIDTNKFIPLDKKDKKIRIIHLRIPDKFIIETFNELSRKDKNLELILDRKCSGKLVEKNKNINFINFLPQIEKLLGKADILIDTHPEKKFLICASPPLLLLEAMSCGMNVISSDVPEISEIVKDKTDGILLKENNALELLKAIRIIKNKRSLGKKARTKMKKEYDIEKVINKYLKIYSLNVN